MVHTGWPIIISRVIESHGLEPLWVVYQLCGPASLTMLVAFKLGGLNVDTSKCIH